jgi:hypothetical protein
MTLIIKMRRRKDDGLETEMELLQIDGTKTKNDKEKY